MKQKKQFRATSAPRLFFDRRIRITGNTKSLSLGKVLPEGWAYVRISIEEREENSITLKIVKLLDAEAIASASKSHKAGKQDS